MCCCARGCIAVEFNRGFSHIHLFSRRAVRRVLPTLDMENICVRAHYKRLPTGYVYTLLRDFQPKLHSLFKSAMTLPPRRAPLMRLPFHAGEVVVTAVKKQGGAGATAGC